MNGYMNSSSLVLNTWEQVEKYIDSTEIAFKPSYLDQVNSRRYPKDAFTLGQLSSKIWLLDVLFNQKLRSERPRNAVLLGCWVGALVQPLLERADKRWRERQIERVYGIDLDPESVELSEQFNHRLVQDSWRYKGVIADCNMLNCADMQFQTSGELIQITPDMVINTSCEHMPEDWFYTCNSDQLIVMQTNDSEQYDGHINTCSDEFEMWDKYPLSDRVFSGYLKTPAYTRYMQIGYK